MLEELKTRLKKFSRDLETTKTDRVVFQENPVEILELGNTVSKVKGVTNMCISE